MNERIQFSFGVVRHTVLSKQWRLKSRQVIADRGEGGLKFPRINTGSLSSTYEVFSHPTGSAAGANVQQPHRFSNLNSASEVPGPRVQNRAQRPSDNRK
jgi:hypothetical protein